MADKVFIRMTVTRPGDPRVHAGLRCNGVITSASMCGIRAVWTGANRQNYNAVDCPDCLAAMPTNPMAKLQFG